MILDLRSLSEHLKGYDSKNITPYIHVMVYHVPKMLKAYENIKQFTFKVSKNLMMTLKLSIIEKQISIVLLPRPYEFDKERIC